MTYNKYYPVILDVTCVTLIINLYSHMCCEYLVKVFWSHNKHIGKQVLENIVTGIYQNIKHLQMSCLTSIHFKTKQKKTSMEKNKLADYF